MATIDVWKALNMSSNNVKGKVILFYVWLVWFLEYISVEMIFGKITFFRTNANSVNCAFIDLSVYFIVWCIKVFTLTCAVPVSTIFMLVVQNSCCCIFLCDFNEAKTSTKTCNTEKKINNIKTKEGLNDRECKNN